MHFLIVFAGHDHRHEVFPIGIVDIADFQDFGFPANAVFEGGGCRIDGGNERYAPILARALEDDHKADDRQDHIHDHAGGDDSHALPDGLVAVGTGAVLVAFPGFIAGHLSDHLPLPTPGENTTPLVVLPH